MQILRACTDNKLEFANSAHSSFKGNFRNQATRSWNNIPSPIRFVHTKLTIRKHAKPAILLKQTLYSYTLYGIPKHFASVVLRPTKNNLFF